jgi:PPOX class probable F420-dependent enzyme
MPTKLTEEELSDLVAEAKVATFCTTNPDGTIHAVPVWFRSDNGSFRFFTGRRSRKCDNLRRDPRVSISLSINRLDDGPSSVALIYGTATVNNAPLAEVLKTARWIMERYVDEEGVNTRLADITDGAVALVDIEPTRIVAYHP